MKRRDPRDVVLYRALGNDLLRTWIRVLAQPRPRARPRDQARIGAAVLAAATITIVLVIVERGRRRNPRRSSPIEIPTTPKPAGTSRLPASGSRTRAEIRSIPYCLCCSHL